MSPGAAVDVLVVDDHDVVQWGLRLVLSRHPRIGRCVTAANGAAALELAQRYSPDVAMVDLFLGSESGAELARRIREVSPRTRILLMSGVGSISRKAAQAAGAAGFVPKDWPADDLAVAVQQVAAGHHVFPAREDGPGGPLTPREQEILTLMARGSTNREIARALHLSPHTVKEHTVSLYRTLEVRNRTEAVALAERLGLVS